MPNSLDAALAASIRLVSVLNGIRSAPDEPPESMDIFPFLIGYVSTSEWIPSSDGLAYGMHTLVLELHQLRDPLPQAIRSILPYGEQVAAIFMRSENAKLPDAQGIDTVDEGIELSATFGPLGYDVVDTIGWTFELKIKISYIT